MRRKEGSRLNDEVLFTQQWAALADLLHREIGRAVKEAFGVTYLVFCLLASVRSHGGTMTLADFPHEALASANTVTVAAAQAAGRGYLEKRRCAGDRRVVQVVETPEGESVLVRGFDAIYRQLCATMWKNHARGDIDETMHAFPEVVRKLGIDPMEINHCCHPILTPSYLMCVAAFLRRWEACVARFAGLSFSEYRCLALLEHRLGSLSCAAIADELALDRSSVSPIVSRLSQEGYVSAGAGTDRRCRSVSLTDKGTVVAALATAELEKVTAELFSDAPASLKARANELHMRMYASYIA